MSCSRDEISEILSGNLTTDIDIPDLFSKAEKMELKCSNSRHYLNYVGLVGAAKIGKTEMIKKIINDHLNKFFFVFYLDLGKIDYEKPINLLNLLVPENCMWMVDEKKTKAVLQTIVYNVEKILFIMDELDTAKFGYASNKFPKVGYFGKRNPSLFILNILRGDIFAESKKIIVSRPFQYYNLPYDCKAKFVATVIGLTRDKQKSICEKEGLLSRIEQLQSKQDIHSLCAVPLNFQTFINYLKDPECSITLTDMVTEVFCRFVRVLNDCQNNFIDLNKLSEFAHSQLIDDKSNKFFFDLRELQNSKLDEVCIDSFFEIELCQKHQPGSSNFSFIKFRFSSLLIQELFAALQLFHYSSLQLEKFLSRVSENLIEKIDNSLNYVVILFLFGLCNDESNNLIENLLGLNDLNVSEIKGCLNEFLRKLALRLNSRNNQNEIIINLINNCEREMEQI